MLNKLLKWQVRSTWKKMLVLFLTYALLCVALPAVLFLFNHVAGEIYSALVFGLGLGAMCILVFIFILLHYNSSMFGDEGHLTLTLPASGEKLLLAHFAVAYLWNVIAYLLMVASGVVLWVVLSSDSEFSQVIGILASIYHPNFGNISAFVVTMLFGLAESTLIIYFSVTVAHLFVWSKGGTAMGVLAFIVIYILQSIPSFLLPGMRNYLRSSFSSLQATPDIGGLYAWQNMLPELLISIVLSAVLFWGTAQLIKKAVSLR